MFTRKQPPPTREHVITGSYNGYTLSDWTRSDAHVKWARDMMSEPMFRDMLAVLSNARPTATLLHISDTEASIALGRRIGYDEMIAIILSLASPSTPEQPPVEPDYGASEFDLKKVM